MDAENPRSHTLSQQHISLTESPFPGYGAVPFKRRSLTVDLLEMFAKPYGRF